MSAKLVVHKFESGINFKSLQITIDESENGSNETRFSEWSEGISQPNKKDTEKSSRLIVKIVSGNGYTDFDLDSCAKQMEYPDVYNTNILEHISSNNKPNLMCLELNDSETIQRNRLFLKLENNSYPEYYTDYDAEEKPNGNLKAISFQPTIYQQGAGNLSSSILEDLSPLEYSLERVKENNARIMENIHLLNRTLDYTKKKEILDIVCPKSMRYPCNTCGKCFVYETGLKKHYSMRHSINEHQPRWQVVWTCIECFQVWPRQDLAIKHASQCCKDNNSDNVREIKTSSLLQCEFCEKVYTSIPRLLRHSKSHTTASNYECNACESTFLCYRTAEQHWMLCPWLKLCYSFSLPKMLLCNSCDRKFKNYEQLYNHRYKVGHFITKAHNSKGVKSLGFLVYQCELCGQWFPSIIPLQTHRSQHQTTLLDNIENYKTCVSDCCETGEIEHQVNQMDDIHNQQFT